MLGLKAGEERNCAALAEATEDDAIVRDSSSDLAGNDVIDKRFALRKSIRVKI